MSQIWAVFGAGPLGCGVAEEGLARGLRVRLITSSGQNPIGDRPGLEAVRADAMRPESAADAAAGASVVFHCANRPYEKWASELGAMYDGILQAAKRARARLVIADNLYMYAQEPQPITEANAIAPPTRKGRIRAELANRVLEAHARGAVQAALVRASDFFGPRASNSHLSVDAIAGFAKGRKLWVVGDPDKTHSLLYAPDFSAAMATVAGAPDDAFGRAWIVPHPPAITLRAAAAALGPLVGGKGEVQRASQFALRLGGLFSPFLRELPEMTVQFDRDFECSGDAFARRFGFSPTPLAEAFARTAAWVKAHMLR